MDIPHSEVSVQQKVQLEFLQAGTCLKCSHNEMKHAAITKDILCFHHKSSVRQTLNCSLAAPIPLRKFVLSNHQQRRQHAELSKPVQKNRTEDIRADEVGAVGYEMNRCLRETNNKSKAMFHKSTSPNRFQ